MVTRGTSQDDSQDRPDLLVIVGPTGCGKTALALDLAERLDGEIISADSVQIYRRFDIGSAKPSPEERSRVPHHLVDYVDPNDPMDAALFAQLGNEHIRELWQRSKLPIVCGGTFLWIRALLFGLAAAPPGDPTVRDRHRNLVEREGRPALHTLLSQRDPTAAQRLNPNDFVRVSRALEVMELTGIPLSEWQSRHGFRDARYRFHLLGPLHERAGLDHRLEERAQRMLESGWVGEVESLLSDGYGSARAMNSVGYRQIREALQAGTPTTSESMLPSIVRATRVFARRQRTWLRDAGVRWVNPSEALATASYVKTLSLRP